MRLVPQMFPGLCNVVAISAGAGDVLALKSDGTVVAWGGGLATERSGRFEQRCSRSSRTVSQFGTQKRRHSGCVGFRFSHERSLWAKQRCGSCSGMATQFGGQERWHSGCVGFRYSHECSCRFEKRCGSCCRKRFQSGAQKRQHCCWVVRLGSECSSRAKQCCGNCAHDCH